MTEGKVVTSKSIISASEKCRIEFLNKSKTIPTVLQEIKEWWSSSSGDFNSLEINSLPFVDKIFRESSTSNTWSPDQNTMARHMNKFRKTLNLSSAEDPILNKLLLNLEKFYVQSFTKGISAFMLAFQVANKLDNFASKFQVIEQSFSNLYPEISLEDIAVDRYPGCLCGLEAGEDKVVTLSSFRFYKAAVDLFRLSGPVAPTVLEIGAGWGGEALYRLMTNRRQKNILVDLQEMCILQYYNLKLRFPHLSICLVSNSISRSNFEKNLEDCDVIIMTDRAFLDLKDCMLGKVNIIRNSDSFIEMTPGQFSTYLQSFTFLLADGGLLFHTNNVSVVDIDRCIQDCGGLNLKESWMECLYEQGGSSLYKSSAWRKS